MANSRTEAEHPQKELLQATERQRAAQYSENTKGDRQALETRDALRSQPEVQVYLNWTEEDEKKHAAGEALPYPRVENVSINGVNFYIERGRMHGVPLQVAVILMEARKIPPHMVPDCPDKQVILREWASAEEERRRRYANIGEGLVR